MGNGTVGIVRTIGTITPIERLLKDILEKNHFRGIIIISMRMSNNFSYLK